MNAFATPEKPGDETHIRSTANWITLLRGVVSVRNTAQPWLSFGVVGPMLNASRKQEGKRSPSVAEGPLDRLNTLITSTCESDEGRMQLYKKAIQDLQRAFQNYHDLSKECCYLSVIFQWPAQLSEEYIELLMEREPEALIVFAHYTVLLSKALPCWWMEGRAERILASIHAHLAPYHRIWMHWPMQELGWVPE